MEYTMNQIAHHNTGLGNQHKRILLATVAAAALFAVQPARADKGLTMSDTPEYFGPMYEGMMKVPVLNGSDRASASTTSFGIPAVIPQLEIDPNSLGTTGSYEVGSPNGTATAGNAFFQSLGTNGRSCFTCHQPSSGMSISVSNIVARAAASRSDPLFAPVDGANCPGAVLRGDPFPLAHSLLLTKGLIRVSLPVPLQTSDIKADGSPNPHDVEYTIKVLHDPNGCNTDPTYSQLVVSGQPTRQMISVYRRPIMSGDLKFKTTTSQAPVDPVTGQPLATDATTLGGFPGFTGGRVLSGNIMWDGREPTFEHQAVDATLGHAQATQPPTDNQVKQIVSFETRMFNGQQTSNGSSSQIDLTVGANGGPNYASTVVPGGTPSRVFNLYDGYRSTTGTAPTDNLRESILRGQEIFNTRAFVISDVAGHNNSAGVDNPATGTCASCHSQVDAGSSRVSHSQRDIGIGGTAGGGNQVHGGPSPSSDLPIFEVTCKPGFSTAFNRTTVQTNDPGLALITGRCSDVGRFTVPTLRALPSRAPYFSDGSATSLSAVVDYYKQRFNVNLNGRDHDDLVNFLGAL
jgi:cytochrome c peroxidase